MDHIYLGFNRGGKDQQGLKVVIPSSVLRTLSARAKASGRTLDREILVHVRFALSFHAEDVSRFSNPRVIKDRKRIDQSDEGKLAKVMRQDRGKE